MPSAVRPLSSSSIVVVVVVMVQLGSKRLCCLDPECQKLDDTQTFIYFSDGWWYSWPSI